MQFQKSYSLDNKLRIIFSLLLLEYLLFIFSGVSFSSLYGNGFFSLQADPVTWLFYITEIPQFICAHQWLAVLLDVLIVGILALLVLRPLDERLAMIGFILLLLYYVTLMGNLAHHNYQFGFCLVLVPFLFKKNINKWFAFEATRYFLVFFYFSAGILKLWNHHFTDTSIFSNLVVGQFTPYFLEGNTSWRTTLNLFLYNHTSFSYALYLGSMLIEIITVVCFFTNRFDKGIAVLILLFHFSSWILMDIAPFGQLAFIFLLFLGNELNPAKNR